MVKDKKDSKKVEKTPKNETPKKRNTKVGPLVLFKVVEDGMIQIQDCPETYTVVKDIKDWMVAEDRGFEDQEFCIAQLKWMGKIEKTIKFNLNDI